MPTTNFIPTPILTHGPRSYGRRDIPRRDYLPISSRPSYPEINDAQTTAVASFGGGCPGTFGPRATVWRHGVARRQGHGARQAVGAALQRAFRERGAIGRPYGARDLRPDRQSVV